MPKSREAGGGFKEHLPRRRRPTDVEIVKGFIELGIGRYAQVGCSITDTISALWAKKAEDGEIDLVTVANEHSLPGIAAGIWFGTGELTLIHMQNSGLPNAGDGLTSFLPVYGIPTIALVTWRGSSEKDDSEPHQAIGRKTAKLTRIFAENVYGARSGKGFLRAMEKAVNTARSGQAAMLRLSPDAFKKTYELFLPTQGEIFSQQEYRRQLRMMEDLADTKGVFSSPIPTDVEFSRVEALQEIVREHPDAAILFSNGYTSRAGQAAADRLGNFYNTGYMGGTLAIGWALARSNPDIEVVVVDGDQNAQMSTMKDNLRDEYPNNLYWYILNNGIGASVGVVKGPSLSLDDYQLARVLNTIPDIPGSFSYPRVGARGVYFESDEAKEMVKEQGALPAHARMFRQWVQEQSTANRKSRQPSRRRQHLFVSA